MDIQFTFSNRGFHNLYDSVLLLFSCLSDFIFISVQRRRIAGWTCFLLSILGLHSPQPSTLNQQNLSNCYSNFLKWKKTISATFPLYWFFTNVSLCLLMIPNSLQLEIASFFLVHFSIGKSTSLIVPHDTCCNISAFCISSAAKDLPTGGTCTGWFLLVNGLEEILQKAM